MQDVPSPIDLRSMDDARAWEATAMEKRPWRSAFFDSFCAQIQAADPAVQTLLELGSGPGFLAAHVLRNLSDIAYNALDFSLAMHALAKQRLGENHTRVNFIERDFTQPNWDDGLAQYDAILTNQAVHELRHKRHAIPFHRTVKQLLKPGGIYLVCDHYTGADGMKNEQLYMSVEEQKDALLAAGFGQVLQIKQQGGLVLHQARI